MFRILFIVLFPYLLFSKIQVVTYFPLETNLVNKIAQQEVKTREITSRYIETYKEIPKSEISKLANVDVFFHFGLEIEKTYIKILSEQNRNLLIVDLSANIDKSDNNPYIWTDPFNMRIVAKNIYDAFVKIDKSKENYYKQNYEKFLEEIDDTFLKIKQKLNSNEIQYIYVFDNHWDYFAKRFRITTVPREKRYLKIAEMPQIKEFTKDKNIKKLLFSQNNNYDYVRTLKSNLNIEIIEDNIFGDFWQFNLLNLTQNLTK